jgi:signal transduction histidine kinase
LRVKEQTLSTRAPTTPLFVLADRQRIAQVLTNLLSNASKFTPVGGHVTIALEPEKGQVRVSVIDTGIGMTREEQARLFTKFYRADNAAVQEAEGTGLGLVITRTLVQMHGGDVEVSSAPGEGSTFSFRLPLA